MTKTELETNESLELLLFTHRFSTAIECGVSLVRSLLALQDSPTQKNPTAMGRAAEEVNQRVQQGYTLSRAMSAHPEIFSPLYIAMVRAGEVGGVLDETLRRLTNLMLKERQLTQRRPSGEPQFLLLQSGKQAPFQSWDELSPYQQAITLILFCETCGVLLSSGVPIPKIIECLAPLLPPAQAKVWEQASETLSSSDSLLPTFQNLGILSPLVLEILKLGEKTGTLDLMLTRAATLYETELECYWP